MKSDESDLLNVESRHCDDVIDVRASADLLHIGQIPLRDKYMLIIYSSLLCD